MGRDRKNSNLAIKDHRNEPKQYTNTWQIIDVSNSTKRHADNSGNHANIRPLRSRVWPAHFIHHQDIFWGGGGVFRDSSLIPLFIGFAVNRSQKTNNPTHKSALELFTIDRLHNNNFAAK